MFRGLLFSGHSVDRDRCAVFSKHRDCGRIRFHSTDSAISRQLECNRGSSRLRGLRYEVSSTNFASFSYFETSNKIVLILQRTRMENFLINWLIGYKPIAVCYGQNPPHFYTDSLRKVIEQSFLISLFSLPL